jgi:hypothetical protein
MHSTSSQPMQTGVDEDSRQDWPDIAELQEEIQPSVLPADIVFPPELCDFLAQVLLRLAKERK